MIKKSPNKKPPLTLHRLLGALSFWGTATRTMLFGFLAAAVFLVAVTEASIVGGVDREVMVLIYVLGSFVLLDFGYVLIARAYPVLMAVDVLALLLADALLALLYIVPKLVVTTTVTLVIDPLTYVLFIPIIVLSLRMLLGLLFGGRRS